MTSLARRAERMGARRIYDALGEQILARVYGINGLLPSSRALACELGVSRGTVTVAYEQLAAEGFIEIRHGARPRVANAVVEAEAKRSTPRRASRTVRLSGYGERLRSVAPRTGIQPRSLSRKRSTTFGCTDRQRASCDATGTNKIS